MSKLQRDQLVWYSELTSHVYWSNGDWNVFADRNFLSYWDLHAANVIFLHLLLGFFSGSESFRAPTCYSMGNESERDLPPYELQSLYQVLCLRYYFIWDSHAPYVPIVLEYRQQLESDIIFIAKLYKVIVMIPWANEDYGREDKFIMKLMETQSPYVISDSLWIFRGA